MPYLQTDDALGFSLGAQYEASLVGFDPDDLARADDWHQRTLARQLLAAEAVWDGLHRAGGATTDEAGDEAGDETVGLTLEGASGALLTEIEELEADRARLDSRLVQAYAALHTVITEQCDQHARTVAAITGRTKAPAGGAISADELFLMEVTAATAIPHGEAARRLRLALAPRRHRGLHERLAAGRVSLMHATMIVEATKNLDVDDEVTTQVADRVLAPMPDGSRPTHSAISNRLYRVIKSLEDPAEAEDRRRRARDRRTLDGQLTEDGMGILSVHMSAERLVAIMDRVERLARAMRQAGDPRTLDQLRSDLASEALLRYGYDNCPAHTPADAPTDTGCTCATHPHEHSPNEQDTTGPSNEHPSGADSSEATSELFASDEDEGPPEPCGCAPPGPPATAWIVVPFEVATGSSDAACELPGHGWVTAAHAREIITAPRSEWRWLAVDHLTGQALQLGTDRYRPTPAMTEQIRALDGHCRAPGCTTPAHRCDLDHHIPYPEGPTTVGNVGPLDRRHHNLKTVGLWHCTATPDHTDDHTPDRDSVPFNRGPRGLHWRTLTGRDYITYPKSWTEALHDPAHPDSTPPGRHRSTPADTRAHHLEARRQRPDWNHPPPF